MSIFDFFSHKNGNDSSERNDETPTLISFASVENIEEGWAKLLVEKIEFQESTPENFANVATFEAFVEVENLPEGTEQVAVVIDNENLKLAIATVLVVIGDILVVSQITH